MQPNDKPTWTDQQIVLQQWLALPKRERKPKTTEQLAAALGVDRTTLFRWRRIPGFMDEVKSLIRDHLDIDLSDVYTALRREAKRGSFQHIRLILELVGDYVERQEHTGKGGGPITYADVSKYTDTELEQLIASGGGGTPK